jgi:hypothetical protein
LKIHFNIIIPFKPRSFKWTLSPRFSQQTVYAPLLFPYVLHFPPTSIFFICLPVQKPDGHDLHFHWNSMLIPDYRAYYLSLIQSAYCRYFFFNDTASTEIYTNITTGLSLCQLFCG